MLVSYAADVGCRRSRRGQPGPVGLTAVRSHELPVEAVRREGTPVPDEVRHDQRREEREQAEDEKPSQLCPLRRATRAGQKASATTRIRQQIPKTDRSNPDIINLHVNDI
jgi:hypothetical protein